MRSLSIINELRSTYNKISDSYHEKKRSEWLELIVEVPSLKITQSGYLLDAGAGNGRNVQHTIRTQIIAIDISEGLLRNYLGHSNDAKIAGSITKLPFRRTSFEEIISIAVIHHLETYKLRENVLCEFYRANTLGGSTTVTVWRKWRSELKQQLFDAIRAHQNIADIVNHRRPWKDATGRVLGIRFYHYYTWKEFYFQVMASQFQIKERKIIGGKMKDSNFLAKLFKK